jgi:hypothetical protein
LTSDVLSELDLGGTLNETNLRVNLYNNALRTWTRVKSGHIVVVNERESVLLKAVGVTDCLDLENHLPKKNNTLHIRTNLPQECAFVRQKLKQRATSAISITSEEEDFATSRVSQPRPFTIAPKPVAKERIATLSPATSEDEAGSKDSDGADHPQTSASRKRKDRLTATPPSPAQHPHPPQRPRLRTCSASSESSSHASQLRSASPEPGLTANHAIVVDDAVWPADFYVVDIVDGFGQCDRARRLRQPIAKAFQAIFGVIFRSTTFYENRRRWESATQASRDESIAAGRTPEGSWTVFIKRNQAIRSQIVGAKTRVRKVRRASIPGAVSP